MVCGSIMGGMWEHYGWYVGALWVVCGSIRERNYRLEKKNYLSGPSLRSVLVTIHVTSGLRSVHTSPVESGLVCVNITM